MSLESKHSQLFEFKPNVLETFDLNRQVVDAKQLSIQLTRSLFTRVQVTWPTP